MTLCASANKLDEDLTIVLNSIYTYTYIKEFLLRRWFLTLPTSSTTVHATHLSSVTLRRRRRKGGGWEGNRNKREKGGQR